MEPPTAAQPLSNHPGARMVPMPKADTVVFSVRMPRELQEVARAERSSINRTVVVAVERYIRQLRARRPKDAQG